MNRLLSVNVGMPRTMPWNGGTVRSAIWKEPVPGPVLARRLNLEGDGQADLRGHGGEQRAVLVYQLSAYRHWHRELGLALDAFGQYGENFTVDGLEDDEVCIGDRYRIGDAVFEVSQPRVTCYRLGIRLAQKQLPALLVAHGRPGFYMRVIVEGHVRAGDEIVKIGAGPEGMKVADVDALLYTSAHPTDELERALRIPALSPGWKGSFEALLQAARAGNTRGNAGLGATVDALAWKGFRPLRVAAIRDESEDVRSFVLAAPDGEPLPTFRPGQHLAVRLTIDAAPVTRMYSLSNERDAGVYRIGVKREADGLASNYLHRHVQLGDTLEASAPRGSFLLLEDEQPVVLLSAGVGVTPMLGMLHALRPADSGTPRVVWWLHSARDGRHHAFGTEVAALMGQMPSGRSHIVYSRAGAADVPGHGFDETGHLDIDMLQRLGVPQQSQFYLCGPAAFLASMESALRDAWGVAPARIHSELFGAGPSVRNPSGIANPPPHAPLEDDGTGPLVTFARSARTVRWADGYGSLLELSEAWDVPTPWSCRTGVCQSCQCALIDGTVTYNPEPVATPDEGTVLLCCARPSGNIELDL